MDMLNPHVYIQNSNLPILQKCSKKKNFLILLKIHKESTGLKKLKKSHESKNLHHQ